jgi:hypothetical protein
MSAPVVSTRNGLVGGEDGAAHTVEIPAVLGTLDAPQAIWAGYEFDPFPLWTEDRPRRNARHGR